MKKIIVIAIALFTAAALYAQPRAIGGRIGSGLELTYQHSLGNNMVQLDFGLPGFNDITGFVGVAGRIGVEYNFWFPMNISLDWRPVIGPSFGKGTAFYSEGLYLGGIALSVRYLF